MRHGYQWLVGWLVGLLVEWLVGRVVGSLATHWLCWLVGCAVLNRLVDDFQNTFVYAFDMFWECLWNVLGMCWGCFGNISEMCWGCSGNVLDMFCGRVLKMLGRIIAIVQTYLNLFIPHSKIEIQDNWKTIR